MKYALPVMAFMALMAGCADHYHTRKGETLILYLDRPDAQQVSLACSLDDFAAHKAIPREGKWMVVLPGTLSFRYYYIVDGEIFLPPCPMAEKDDLGSENCIFDPQW